MQNLCGTMQVVSFEDFLVDLYPEELPSLKLIFGHLQVKFQLVAGKIYYSSQVPNSWLRDE